ncbi:MAG: BamA/TamA family outer membrane protein, partial [Mucispirillum sp.]|nr:BamA/TamA family outer membrane protein [Mucispirillum sp.]
LFFSGQWVSGTIFSGERFYIGGIYSVRGFESGLESGDNGYRLSVEAEFDLGIPHIKALVFYDRGQVFNYNADYHGYGSASLDSAGAGLRFYPWKGLAIKFDYGYPLMSSQNREAGWGVIYGRISYDF